jgi:hypothetical protein
MKTPAALAREHRVLGCTAMLHSAVLLGLMIGIDTGFFHHLGLPSWPWWLHHLWVGVASLWLLWPLILIMHPGASSLRIAVPIMVGTLFLLPCIRDYHQMVPVTFGVPTVKYEVTYYDRNGDGTVDFEFHHAPQAYDADWALSDSNFRGRYDLKIEYSPFGEKRRVDIPVPTHVKMTPGEPQLWRVR